MNKFFWAKHIEAKKSGKLDDAKFYMNMIKKVGSKIVIPQRKFVGNHQRVREICEEIINENMLAYFEELKTTLKQ